MGLIYNTIQDTSRDNVKMIVVNLDSISNDDKDYIKKNLVMIAKGISSQFSSKIIASKLLTMFSNQSEENRNGLTAEFFQAVILRNQQFEQKYAYMNLEENSAKKGFDGLYMKSNEVWLLESKSSFKEINHKITIDRAYKGINSMLSGKTSNDPWENAESHVSKINSSDNLIRKLVKLSSEYTNGTFQKISDNNIILGSNIITSDISIVETDISKLEQYVTAHTAKEETVVILSFTTPRLFFDILKEICDE